MLSAGDPVRHLKLNLKGTVIKVINKEQLECLFGLLKLKVKISDIEALNSSSNLNKIEMDLVTKEVSDEIDLHGKTKTDAEELLLDYIQKAILLKKTRIKVIHGIGNAILKNMVHQCLKNNQLIKSCEIDPLNPGQSIICL